MNIVNILEPLLKDKNLIKNLFIKDKLIGLCDNHDKSFIHYHDKAIFYYCDNSKFADTTVYYTKHTRILV